MDLPLFADPEVFAPGRHRLRVRHSTCRRASPSCPRYGATADVRWFEADPCYIYHTMNAWEDGDAIVHGRLPYPTRPAPSRPRATGPSSGLDARVPAPRRPVVALPLRPAPPAPPPRVRWTTSTPSSPPSTPHSRASPVATRTTSPSRADTRRCSTGSSSTTCRPELLAAVRLRSRPVRLGSSVRRTSDERRGRRIPRQFRGQPRGRVSECVIIDAPTMTEVGRVRSRSGFPHGFHACWVSQEQLETTRS
jgi:hypothetical protein